MPPKEKELTKLFITINGKVFEPLSDIKELSVETSGLDDEIKSSGFTESGEFKCRLDIHRGTLGKPYAGTQIYCGKITVETSCVCDGTLCFAIELMQKLAKIGAVNIKCRSEEVQNPNPSWMRTKFIVSGIIRNTNNFRKLHGIPMKRRWKV